MKIKFLLALIAFVLINNFLYPAKIIVFKLEVPKKDSSWIEVNKTNMAIKIKATSTKEGEKTFETENYKLIKKEITVIDSNDNMVNKIKVTYKNLEKRINENGTETNTNDSPVINKTYIIERLDNNDKKDVYFKVSYENGDLPPQEETDYILSEEYSSSKDLDFNSSELKDKKIKVGEKVEYFNNLFDDFIGEFDEEALNDNNKKDYSVILKDVKKINGRDCGLFDIIFKIKFKDKNTEMVLTLDLKGEIIIDINTSQILKFNIFGPMIMDGNMTNEQDTIVLKGNGSIDHLYDQLVK